MTRKTIEITLDWQRSLRRKTKIILTEYKNGKALKPKHVKN